MADIAKITLPSGDTYDLKDSNALRVSTEFTSNTFSGITWENGSILSADGTISYSGTQRIHTTSYIPMAIAYIKPLDGYRFTLPAYDHDGTYVGMWNGSALEKSATWFTSTDTVDLTKIGNYRFKVCGSRNPSSTVIDPSEGANIIFTTSVDAMVYYQNFLLSKIAGFTIYDGTVV